LFNTLHVINILFMVEFHDDVFSYEKTRMIAAVFQLIYISFEVGIK